MADPGPERKEAGAQRGGVRLPGTGLRVHDQVHGRQLLLVGTEGFADDPLDAVAPDGVAGGPHADGEA